MVSRLGFLIESILLGHVFVLEERETRGETNKGMRRDSHETAGHLFTLRAKPQLTGSRRLYDFGTIW